MKWEQFKGFKRWCLRRKFLEDRRPKLSPEGFRHINSPFCCCTYCIGKDYYGHEIEFVRLHGRYPYPGELNWRPLNEA